MQKTFHTPFLPAFRARFAPAGARVSDLAKAIDTSTLAKVEDRFGSVLSAHLLDTPSGMRQRLFTVRRTFWCFLWQILNPGTPCREVVRQLQALFTLERAQQISESDGGYCQARQRLPKTVFHEALNATAKAAQNAAPPQQPGFLQDRPRKVVDGTTVTMPDSEKNRKAYPKTQFTPQSTGFPMMRVVALFCLASGAILGVLTGNFHTSELALFGGLIPQLTMGDILLGDRGFGSFVAIFLMRFWGVDFIGRSTRKVDRPSRVRRLGRNDWVVRWPRPSKQSALMSESQWAAVPDSLDIRVVLGRLKCRGFRVRQVIVVTTLLDANLYPADQILQAYAQRWRLELCFDDLKTTLQMEMLSCQSPDLIDKELHLHLIVHNLIRLVAAQAASAHHAPVDCISFKGTLDALRQFCQAINQARNKDTRRSLWEELLRSLVADRVPWRPGRREPRAIKRRKNKYPRLNCSRHKFRDRPKRNVRRSRALLRSKALN